MAYFTPFGFLNCLPFGILSVVELFQKHIMSIALEGLEKVIYSIGPRQECAKRLLSTLEWLQNAIEQYNCEVLKLL